MAQPPNKQGEKKLQTVRQIPLGLAKMVADAAEEEAEDIGVAMVITVADPHGNVIVQRRMDNAWLPSVSISQQKAYTAAGFEFATSQLADPTVPGESLWGLHTTDDGNLVIFGGGIPLVDEDDEVVGAIGVSGGAVSEDEQVAQAGVDEFEELLDDED